MIREMSSDQTLICELPHGHFEASIGSASSAARPNSAGRRAPSCLETAMVIGHPGEDSYTAIHASDNNRDQQNDIAPSAFPLPIFLPPELLLRSRSLGTRLTIRQFEFQVPSDQVHF